MAFEVLWLACEVQLVIRHEAIGMNLKAGLLAGFSRRFQEQLAILLFAENRLAAISAAHDMINGSRKLDADFSWHGSYRADTRCGVNQILVYH